MRPLTGPTNRTLARGDDMLRDEGGGCLLGDEDGRMYEPCWLVRGRRSADIVGGGATSPLRY